MAELSMFETLMSLPLFKGASHEQIALFVEKTHLSFNSYEPGEMIVAASDVCRNVCCLLSGTMSLEHPVFFGNIIVREVVGQGRFLGVEKLFGLDNRFSMSARALVKCGIMEFSKNQYLTLLQSNQIFLMNSLNYISRYAQKCESVIAEGYHDSLLSVIVHIIETRTSAESRRICIESTRVPLLEYLSSVVSSASSQLDSLCDAGLVRSVTDYKLEILSREQLINAYRHNVGGGGL
ncbi:MAG: cyclic nucleotide-binding domain-containing protein [Muribaculaceae bacterium]|nr:cyclic nucleotide-binding domain-containing protein [Muribaculaceae bacterium]